MAISSFSSFSVIPPPPPPPPPPQAKAEPAAVPPPPPQPQAKVEPPRPEPKPEPKPAPVVRFIPVPQPPEPEPPRPSRAQAFLRRWPWLVLGTAAGLAGGYLFYLQQPGAEAPVEVVVRNNPTRGDEAWNAKLAGFDAQIQALRGQQGALAAEREGYQARLRGGEVNGKTVPGISQEDLTGVRARIAANKLVRDELTRKLARIDSDIALIASVAGAGRSERLAVMSKLGIPPDRPAVAPDAENPEELLRTRKQERQKLAARLGPDHREMVVLQKEIDRLEKVVQQRKTDGQEMDELGRHLVALKREQAVLGAEGKKLDEAIAADEKTAAAIGELQGKIDRVQGDEAQVARRVQEKELEKAQAVAARPGAPKPEATTTSEPAAQTTPAAPTLSQPLWVGALLGLLLGGGCALAGALGGRTPRPSGDIRRLGVPVLGTVPKIRTDLPSSRPSTTGLDPLLAAFFRPNGPDSAAYHAIRDQLLALTDGWGHQVLQVSSPGPGDGKSTLAANLAISLAQSGKRVLLLDCDFGTARIQRLFNLRRPEVGLTSVTGGEVTLEAAVQGSEIPNLFVMGCGSRPSNPADLLGGPKFAEVLAEVRDRYEFVVVDTPPVLTTGDAAVLAAQADGVLLVFRTGKDAGLAERAREQLGAVGARVLGAVANTGARGPAGPVGPMQQPVRPAERPPAEEPIGALPKKG